MFISSSRNGPKGKSKGLKKMSFDMQVDLQAGITGVEHDNETSAT